MQHPDTAPNAHVHPVFQGILNAHAAIPVRAAPAAVVADMQAIVDGIKARSAAKAAAEAQRCATLPAAPLKSAAQLQAELQIELAGFDPAYQHCDDYGEWARQAGKASRIADIRRQLAQGVAA